MVAGESDSEATDSDSSSVVHEVDESTEVNVGEGDITEGGEERSGDGEEEVSEEGPGVRACAKEAEHNSNESVVNAALLARIEFLEAKNAQLSKTAKSINHFGINQICHNNKLIRFYTGFVTYSMFLAFFTFLGPSVNELNYWGSKRKSTSIRHRSCKLDPKDQLFLTLMKLRLNFPFQDLAFRFGISKTAVSRYFTTWICFLYHHLKEVDWVPSVEQVAGTLPQAFKEKYPTTYAIIDGTEIFIEIPHDLFLQSSTWSAYKHHNTAKFLVACSPNGAIIFISPLYLGSVSDVQLTRISGFLDTIADKPGISIMADRGFTIRDMLQEINIDLNMPPFLDGRSQLPANEVNTGRKIASLRVHVERAIGRIKNYGILKATIPLALASLLNQIVHVCAFLTNFQPPLVPPSVNVEVDVDNYFHLLSDSSNSDTSSDGDDLSLYED